MNDPTPNPSPLSKMAQPLSIGNVVNVGIQIYRNHAKDYFNIALRATLWILAPLLLGLVGTVLFLALQVNPGVLVVLAIACFALFIYAIARFLGESALITRLAFTTLMNQPESPSEASRYTVQRKWQFFWLAILLGLLSSGIAIGLLIALSVVGGIASVFAGISTTGGGSVASAGIFIAIAVLFYVVLLLLFIWLGLRLYLISEAPLAVESGMTPGGSIGRSWTLTKGSFWRIFWIWSVLALIMLPVQMLQQIASTMMQSLLAVVADPLSGAFAALTFLVAIAVSLMIGIVILPVWQAVKATLYYDLRSRREGLALPIAEPMDTAGSGDRLLPDPPTSPLRWLKTVEVVTPERVGLQFVLAGIGGRGHAMAIDLAILIGVWAIGALLYSIFAIQLLEYLSNTDFVYDQVPLWLLAIAFLVTFVLFSGYFVFFEVMWQGQTPGKRAAQIRVIREDGRPVGLAQAVLRSLLLAFDGIPLFLGVIFILFEKREKRLGDIVAGTLVVQEEKPIAKAVITLSDRAKQLAQDLPQMTNLSMLQPDDFATIHDYLERRSHMNREARRDLSLTLARQMRSRIEMETIPSGLTSDEFLESVYLAYQNQFGGA